MPFWGDDKEEILKLVKELNRLYDKEPEQLSQMESKIHELINKLNKTSEKTFNKIKEIDIDDLGGCSVSSLISLVTEATTERSPETGMTIARNAAMMLIGKKEPEDAIDLYLDVGKTLAQKEMFKPVTAFLNEALSICERQATVLRAQAQDEDDSIPLAVKAEGLDEKKQEIKNWMLACQLCMNESVSKSNIQPLLKMLESGGRDQRTAALRILEFFGNESTIEMLKNLKKQEKDKEIRSLMKDTIDAIEIRETT